MLISNKNLNLAEELISIGIALSSEKDTDKLLENILLGAKSITHADGGTLYLLDEENKTLNFAIMQTDSLGIFKGGSTGEPIELQPIPLCNNGIENVHNIAAYAANKGQTVNINDAYCADGFDFSGVKNYDENTGYRSTSFLAIPMKNHANEIIGVLQLINAQETETGNVVPFMPNDQRLAEALASQAAIVLTNNNLNLALKDLLEKFIEIIAAAIDEKSPYTGGHCRRVPDIAMLLGKAVHNTVHGVHAQTTFSDEEFYELKIAALLHDCGKITTPVHVVDKATKLETIYDRIQTIDARFEIIRRELEILMLREQLDISNLSSTEREKQLEQLNTEYQQQLSIIAEEQEFLTRCNTGGEFMREDDQMRIRDIAQRTYNINGEIQPLLNNDEIENLCIPKGTLTDKERLIINNHIVLSQRMLQSLPFPKPLKNVPEIAGNHHERMDGKGYPNGLTKEQMSIQARIMGIADIFEALTATDRPYKKPMTISQALNILGKMAEEQHIDADIFSVFIEQEVYLEYANKTLSSEQIDHVDIDKIPGLNNNESARRA